MTEKQTSELLRVARETILAMENRTDLERHFSDEEDFLDVAVWELKAALTVAFELGKASR
jgi:hypothetical protein